MKFSGRFKSRPEVNVGIGGCASPQPILPSHIPRSLRADARTAHRMLMAFSQGIQAIERRRKAVLQGVKHSCP